MDNEVNLNQLMRLKAAFDEAAEGGDDVSAEVFVQKLGPMLGGRNKKGEMMQLFAKIDADCGGTIDWDEFTSYILGQGKSELASQSAVQYSVQDVAAPTRTCDNHKGSIQKIYTHPDLRRFFTCERDGTVRAWASHNLTPVGAIDNGKAWVVDVAYLPRHKRLICVSMDRAISAYNISRGNAFELTGRALVNEALGNPYCITAPGAKVDDPKFLAVFGDMHGNVAVLYTSAMSLPPKIMTDAGDKRDYQVIHRGHTDWVTQVKHVSDVGVISCGLDGKIIIASLAGRILHTIAFHTQGIQAMVYSSTLAVGVSAGLQREIYLWQSMSTSPYGVLRGHSDSVMQLALVEQGSQVVSLSADGVIKIWDLKSQSLIQSLDPKEQPAGIEARPTAIWFDESNERLLSACQRPISWKQKLAPSGLLSHSCRIVAALYNEAFDLVVSCDESGTMSVWDYHTGTRSAFSQDLHCGRPLTSAIFDSRQRRLLTASDDGIVRMWNFNSGSLLRQFITKGSHSMTTCLSFVSSDNDTPGKIFAGGWAPHKIQLWEDVSGANVTQHNSLVGHRHDILCLAQWQEELLATGDQSGCIILWDIASQQQICTFQFQDGLPILAMTFCNVQDAAPILASCSGTGRLQFWDIRGRSGVLLEVSAISVKRLHLTKLCYDPEHQKLAAGSTSGRLVLWSLSHSSNDQTDASCIECNQENVLDIGTAHITSLDFGRNDCLAVGCSNGSVKLVTTRNELVGEFGVDTWSIDDPETWRAKKDAENAAEQDARQTQDDDALPGAEDSLQDTQQRPGDTLPERTVQDIIYHSKALRESVQKLNTSMIDPFSSLKLHAPSVVPWKLPV